LYFKYSPTLVICRGILFQTREAVKIPMRRGQGQTFGSIIHPFISTGLRLSDEAVLLAVAQRGMRLCEPHTCTREKP